MLDIRTVTLGIFFVWLFVDGIAVSRNMTGRAENRDRFSLVLVVVGDFVALFAAISLSYSSIGSMNSIVLQFAGLAVMGIGIIVRSIAIAQLGRFHTPNVAVRQGHRLIESGLYRHVRHPSYLGALIAFFGFSVALGNWLGVAIVTVVTLFVYLFRIREEEAALDAALGDEYRAYRRRTKRLFPGLY